MVFSDAMLRFCLLTLKLITSWRKIKRIKRAEEREIQVKQEIFLTLDSAKLISYI